MSSIRVFFINNLLLVLAISFFGCNPNQSEQEKIFSPFSNSVIRVKYLSNNSDTLYLQVGAFTLIPRDLSKSNSVPAINSGSYLLNIQIDRPVCGQILINNDTYNIMLQPNDTIDLKIINEEALEIKFSGKNKEINTYYQKKKERLKYSDIKTPFNQNLNSTSTYQQLKQDINSITGKELEFLDDYSSSNYLPSWFINYEKTQITYSGAGFKTAIPSINKMLKRFNDSLPEDYYGYLNNLKIDNQSAILSSKYMSFLESYFTIDLPTEYDNLRGFERVNKIRAFCLKQSKQKLSGPVREIYHMYLFSDLLKYYTDSVEIDSLAKAFEINNYDHLLRVSGTRSKGGVEYLNLSKGDTIPEFYVTNSRDSLVSIRDFNSKVLYINFWATWCGPCIKNIPALNEMITEYSTNDNITFLNICLDSEKGNWINSVAKHQLKGVNLLAEGNWNKKLKAYFNITGIPQYVILGEENILVENHTNKAPLVKENITNILQSNTRN